MDKPHVHPGTEIMGSIVIILMLLAFVVVITWICPPRDRERPARKAEKSESVRIIELDASR